MKLLLVILAALLLLECYKTTRSPSGDFANYYTASRLALADSLDKVDLYDHYGFQQQIQRYFRGTLGSFIPFPPSTVLVMIPLAWLPPSAARNTSMIINMLALCTIIWFCSRLSGLPLFTVSIIALLSGFSLWSNFREGQVYLVLTLLIALALAAEGNGKNFLAGLLLGAAAPIKYFTLLFIAYFLLRKNYRLVMGAIVSTLAVFGAGLVFAGVGVNEYYLTDILPRHLAGNIQNPFAVNFQSFNSLINSLLVRSDTLNPNPVIESAFLASWLKLFLSLFFLLLLVGGIYSVRWKEKKHRTLYDASLLTLFGLVTSPASASYHLVLLILPMVFLVSLFPQWERENDVEFPRRRMLLIGAAYVAINMVPFQLLCNFTDRSLLQLLAYSKLFLLVTLFMAALPPDILHSRLLRRSVIAAFAFSFAVALARHTAAKEKDGAVWTGVDGLIIADLSYHDGSLYYCRETPSGFVGMKDGRRWRLNRPLPDRTTEDGVFTAFDSSLGSSREIFIRDNTICTIHQVTRSRGINKEPVWSSDGSRLYFLSDRGRGIDCTTIFYIPVERSELR